MQSLILALYLVAMLLAWRDRRGAGVGCFAAALALSVIWLRHHMTDPLQLGF